MSFLDDLYFYLLNKFLTISFRICGWFDDVLGLAAVDPDQDEGGKNGD